MTSSFHRLFSDRLRMDSRCYFSAFRLKSTRECRVSPHFEWAAVSLVVLFFSRVLLICDTAIILRRRYTTDQNYSLCCIYICRCGKKRFINILLHLNRVDTYPGRKPSIFTLTFSILPNITTFCVQNVPITITTQCEAFTTRLNLCQR